MSAGRVENLSKATVNVLVKGNKCRALLDTGSSDGFMCQRLVNAYNLCVHPESSRVSMASTSLSTTMTGHCLMNLKLMGSKYCSVRLSILPDICSDVILGQDFMKHHEWGIVQFGGDKPLFPLHTSTTTLHQSHSYL